MIPENVTGYMYRPFDCRWLYWEPETKLLDEKRTEYKPHVFEGNLWIEVRERQPMDNFNRGAVVRDLGDNLGNGLSSYIPLYLAPTANREQTSLFPPEEVTGPEHNISVRARAYVEGIGSSPEDLFFHVIATLNTPRYRTENAGALVWTGHASHLPSTGRCLNVPPAVVDRFQSC